jgi:hypothetical protein
VVLALSFKVLGLGSIVLERWKRPNQVLAGREPENRRLFAVSFQALAQSVPSRDALVVSAAHRELSVRDGTGLIAEDLPEVLPAVLVELEYGH